MHINIIGAGLSGLSSAVTLAQHGIPVSLISAQTSERAQSVLAEGGINGALDVMGEQDSTAEHAADTMKAGAYIADPAAVDDLCRAAPDILSWFAGLGVPFNMEDGHIIQRNFGGQKKKRTAFARSSIGRALMTALIDACRQYEAEGLICRFSHHEFEDIRLVDAAGQKVCAGVWVRDLYRQNLQYFSGPVILCTGGINGFFPGRTTGTTANTGEATARLFLDGVRLSNLEMIQYHPTTISIADKRLLVSEAARGEGGRLFIMREGQPFFFMEDKYPELGNLMSRDIVAREIDAVVKNSRETDAPAPAAGRKQKLRKGSLSCTMCRSGQVYLEMRHLPEKIWREKLPDLREELLHYLHLDPVLEPIPVEPGIHYFMGGIDVDRQHRTNIAGLYAAGECCSQYHGANRLGGNSTLGAVYGGITAAETAAAELQAMGRYIPAEPEPAYAAAEPAGSEFIAALSDILYEALGIVRNAETARCALRNAAALKCSTRSRSEQARLAVAEAMLLSSDFRKESRGAHYREDFPEQDEQYRGMTTAVYDPDTAAVTVGLRHA